MFQQAIQPYVFGIESVILKNDMQEEQVNPAQLRELWSKQLLKEEEEFNKLEGLRHPLTRELKAWNFFSHH